MVRSHLYGGANLFYEFLGPTQVNVSGKRFSNGNERLWGGVSLGGTHSWGDGTYSLYGEVALNTGLDNVGDSYSVGGTVGWRMRW